MNSTTYNVTLFDRVGIVIRVNEDTFRKLIPSIFLYGVLSVLGTTGNILSIYIFTAQMRRNLQNDLFILLSFANLLACGVCLPVDILDMRHMYLYPSTLVCKISRFLNMFTMVASTLTLCTLAIVRLRAASSKAVISSKRSVRVTGIVALLLVSVSISWIAAIVFGMRSNPTFVGDIMGQNCSVADDTNNTAWPRVFLILLCTGFIFLIVVTILAYYRIWRIIRKNRKAVTSHTVTTDVLPCSKVVENTERFRAGPGWFITAKTRNRFIQKTLTHRGISGQKVASSGNGLEVVDDVRDVNVRCADLTSQTIQLVSALEENNKRHVQDALFKKGTRNSPPSMKSEDRLSVRTISSDSSHCKESKSTEDLMKAGLQTFTEPVTTSEENPANNFGNNIWKITDGKIPAHFLHKMFDQSLTTSWEIQTTNFANDKSKNENRKLANDKTSCLAEADLKTSTTRHVKQSEKTDANTVKHELKRKAPRTSLETAVTRTAFLLTVTFLVSYVPFLLVSIPRAINKNFDYSQDAVKLNLINTAVRLYFIMPTISPFIFWASNLDFRRKCRALWSRSS